MKRRSFLGVSLAALGAAMLGGCDREAHGEEDRISGVYFDKTYCGEPCLECRAYTLYRNYWTEHFICDTCGATTTAEELLKQLHREVVADLDRRINDAAQRALLHI